MKGIKTGGREQGTPNRVTQLQREFIQSLLNTQQNKITIELNSLNGKDYLTVISGLMEFVMPKLQRTELKTDTNNCEIIVKIGYGEDEI